MALSKRLAQVGRECVACGTCVKVCPRTAIRVASGVTARVDGALCLDIDLLNRHFAMVDRGAGA